MMKPRTNEADWLRMVDEAIEAVLDASAACERGSPEWDALCSEPTYLRRLRDEVRNKPPGQRDALTSRLMCLAAREHLDVPTGILEQVGTVADLYRRWANRPEWREGGGPAHHR